MKFFDKKDIIRWKNLNRRAVFILNNSFAQEYSLLIHYLHLSSTTTISPGHPMRNGTKPPRPVLTFIALAPL